MIIFRRTILLRIVTLSDTAYLYICFPTHNTQSNIPQFRLKINTRFSYFYWQYEILNPNKPTKVLFAVLFVCFYCLFKFYRPTREFFIKRIIDLKIWDCERNFSWKMNERFTHSFWHLCRSIVNTCMSWKIIKAIVMVSILFRSDYSVHSSLRQWSWVCYQQLS